jgi:hypothetical protein
MNVHACAHKRMRSFQTCTHRYLQLGTFLRLFCRFHACNVVPFTRCICIHLMNIQSTCVMNSWLFDSICHSKTLQVSKEEKNGIAILAHYRNSRTVCALSAVDFKPHTRPSHDFAMPYDAQPRASKVHKCLCTYIEALRHCLHDLYRGPPSFVGGMLI